MSCLRPEQARQDYLKLAMLRKHLQKVCNAINTEMLQTDVEWLNLSTLAKTTNEGAREANSKTADPGGTTSKKKELVTVGPSGQSEELPQLDLNPSIAAAVKRADSDEEFDSDD